MKNNLLILITCIFAVSCTVSIGDSKDQAKKSDEEIVNEMCNEGNLKACEVVDLIQKKKEEKYQRVIKESGIRSK
ncbi:hypothetical protein GCL60_02070 [Silvanigrella paludirubra]|uniref:Lipoprotein n=1 Tax=Silvanigrella paludirubra TaxID=2499159 RepID=A0A6N6VZK8_9BACT|nr:hypothetical protein [Silvanigrella paludirubra]KAB8040736.1 hypothetical protein GCL60_02070 [Silvanigrella paludirubra]